MRKAILWCLLLLPALAALSLAAASGDEEGEKLLRGLSDAYKKADSISYDLKIWQAPRSVGADAMVIKAKVSLKKPNLAKVEVTSDVEGVGAVLICDGSTIWEYDPGAHLCLKRQAPDDPGEIAGKRGGLRYCEIGTFFSKDPYTAFTKNTVNVTASGQESLGGVECSVAVTDYGRYKEKLFIGRDDNILRKTSVIVAGPEDEEEEAMSDIRTDVRLDSDIDRTAFSPPELADGTKVIEVPKMKDDVIVAGQKAPEFTVKRLDGSDVSLSDYKGKTLLIDFWASWCVPCKMVIPKLKELQKEFGDKGLTVIGLDVWDQEEMMKKAIDDLEIDYTVLYAPQGESMVDLQYGLEGIPTVYLIDREGVIRGGWIGPDPAHEEGIRKALADLGIK